MLLGLPVLHIAGVNTLLLRCNKQALFVLLSVYKTGGVSLFLFSISNFIFSIYHFMVGMNPVSFSIVQIQKRREVQ